MSPAPVYVARAIADALADDARAADRYLTEHDALLRAGVPVEHVRAVLDLELRETPSTLAVSAWNDRGTLCLCGSLGIGKTIAAAQWMLEAVRSGVSCMWLNAVDWSETEIKAQPALVARAKRVRALVIDDIGAGTTGPRGHRTIKPGEPRDWYFQQMEGVLMSRAAKPTIALANFNGDTMRVWMGPRLMDRESMYGEVVFIQGSSLRRPDGGKYSGDGLGPKHAAARELVDALGVAPASSWVGQGWVDGTWNEGAEVWRVDVGHVLEQRTRSAYAFARSSVAFELGQADDDARIGIEAGARKQGLRACSNIAKAHKLDGETIRAAALALEANDPVPDLREEFDAAKARVVDNLARAKTCYTAMARIHASGGGPPGPGTGRLGPGLWPEFGDDINTKLRALGFRVRARAGRFEVRKMLLDEHGQPMKRDKDDLGQMMLDGDGDARDGWSAANRLAAL